LPEGTTLSAGQVLVIGRSATRSEFEGFWGALPPTALYLNAEADSNGVPIVNGNGSRRDRFVLLDARGETIDGPTIDGVGGNCYGRTGRSAGDVGAWNVTVADRSNATPGTVEATGVQGLVISEWCDAPDNFVFEFIELTLLP
jgi:hypothetical protein